MKNDTIHIAGIDLPKQLYDAAINDELVIFVGAGVSLPSNVPDFPDLAKEIINGAADSVDDKFSPSESLERAEAKGLNIQRETKRIINHRNKGPASTHDNLIDIYRKKTLRLVTTNFDLNLSLAAKKKKLNHRSYYNPAFPTGDDFEGIVYLHGAISDENSLIITERDFARSYLKYGRQMAFIRELFSKFTVLFIGYSYNDKIFQFLSKSEDFQIKRYMVVSDEKYQLDQMKWELLNLSAIPYNSSANHKQLWDMIKIWGDLINWQPSEHRIEIIRIARKRGTLNQQESDYIKCCLGTESHAKYFFQHAKSERWLKWAYDQNLLDIFYKIELQYSVIASLIYGWFSDNFVTKNNKLSLKIIEENSAKPLNPQLIDSITLAFHRTKKLPPRSIFSKWLHIIIYSSGFISNSHISYILLKCRIPQDIDIALLLLNKLTFPTGLKERRNSDAAKYWVRKIWDKQFKPKISSIAYVVEPLITHHLKLHELQKSTKYNLHPFNYISRPAIEENESNHKRDMSDVLIDISRDLIDYFVVENSKIAAEVIERWYQQNTIIHKRLSVYGMSKYRYLSAAEKLEWLLSKKELLKPALKHENFYLIRKIYSKLGTKDKQCLITTAEHEAKDEYSIYNFMVWLNNINPKCKLAKNKLDKLQQKNPEYGSREHPDLDSYMSPVQFGYISPLTSEDMLKLELNEIIKLLDTYKSEKGIRKPEREGLLDTLGEAVKNNFNWSFNLAQSVAIQQVWHSDIWKKIIGSWSETKSIVREDANKIVKFLLVNEVLHTHHYKIARFLSEQDKNIYQSKENEIQSITLANKIRDGAFYDRKAGKVCISDDTPDWWAEAINSTGHYLCYYFIRLFDEKYQKSQASTEKLNDFFLPFIENKSYTAQMGKITLAHYLGFFDVATF